MTAWQTRSSREVYANPWIRVREDEVVRPDGGNGVYGVVEVRQPAVFVVAITKDQRVLLVHLDRYTVGDSWEVPAGGSDGQDLREAGARELLEETGYAAREWRELGVQHSLNGVAQAEAHVFLAQGLTRTDGVPDEAEGIAEVEAFAWGDIRRMLAYGEISDSETAGALLLAAVELGWA